MFSKLWALLDGCKLYIVCVLGILQGSVGLLQEYLTISGGHNFQTLLPFLANISKDPNWLTILAGFAGLAAAHKGQKILTAINPPPIEPPKP